jgi:hypothetical protein
VHSVEFDLDVAPVPHLLQRFLPVVVEQVPLGQGRQSSNFFPLIYFLYDPAGQGISNIETVASHQLPTGHSYPFSAVVLGVALVAPAWQTNPGLQCLQIDPER